MKPQFFAKQADLRRWFEKNHDRAQELWIGYYKKASVKASITYAESVDEALCFGWIDGIRKSVDDASYMNRFTPRKSRSIWSTKNIRRAEELIELGLMTPPGLEAFTKRTEDRARQYSFEQGDVALSAEYEKLLRANRKAWAFFQVQPPYYRRVATWWVISAKREDTRRRRLNALIRDSEAGRRIGLMKDA